MSRKLQPGEPVTVIIPPHIQVLLTGAWRLQIGAHDARLDYTDGTSETVPAESLGKVREADGNWFALVSAVQAQREGGAR